jgi:hypothetical protein
MPTAPILEHQAIFREPDIQPTLHLIAQCVNPFYQPTMFIDHLTELPACILWDVELAVPSILDQHGDRVWILPVILGRAVVIQFSCTLDMKRIDDGSL